jgi:hypothetical protein
MGKVAMKKPTGDYVTIWAKKRIKTSNYRFAKELVLALKLFALMALFFGTIGACQIWICDKPGIRECLHYGSIGSDE